LNPDQPASMSIDSPDGDTTSVAWPPSTSTKYTSSVLRACAVSGALHAARIKDKVNTTGMRISISIEANGSGRPRAVKRQKVRRSHRRRL
jgi:hypothetical protein